MNDDELARIIAKLRADYARELPATIAQMDDLWRGLIAATIPWSRLGDLTRMAHSIAGSGKTFGLPGASSAARALESFLEQIGGNGGPPGSPEQARMAALLAELRQAASPSPEA
ncbi:MAG: Hpt domain-containing protein [Burkholderiales bacterium]